MKACHCHKLCYTSTLQLTSWKCEDLMLTRFGSYTSPLYLWKFQVSSPISSNILVKTQWGQMHCCRSVESSCMFYVIFFFGGPSQVSLTQKKGKTFHPPQRLCAWRQRHRKEIWQHVFSHLPREHWHGWEQGAHWTLDDFCSEWTGVFDLGTGSPVRILT